jgi:hypothetical protein
MCVHPDFFFSLVEKTVRTNVCYRTSHMFGEPVEERLEIKQQNIN